eukprot:3500894-Alexandrium_andersonii.AAC.1
MALATQAAPSAATESRGRQPSHQATPALAGEGVGHAAPTRSDPQQQQARGRCSRSALVRRTARPSMPPPSSRATWVAAVKSG